MAIYAISDLHLSLANPKPMDIFGPVWTDHADTIRRNWDRVVRDSDAVLMPGDLSWAMRLPDAEPDLNLVAERPGTKVLIRGNHDYWWRREATSRIQREVDRNMFFLQGTSVMIGDVGVAGTRGWRVDWETADSSAISHQPSTINHQPSTISHSQKILARELSYLERGLQSIPDSAKVRIAMLHFPPFDEQLRPNEFAELLAKHSVDILVYGHVHRGLGNWLEGDVNGVRYHMVSADVVDFTPRLIVPD